MSLSKAQSLSSSLALLVLPFMILMLFPSFGFTAEARKVTGQGVLEIIKNNRVIEAPMDLSRQSRILIEKDFLKELKIFLVVDSLNLADAQLLELLKSSVFFDSKKYKFIEVRSLSNISLDKMQNIGQSFSGKFLLKVKNKSQELEGNGILIRTSKECRLSFSVVIPDRTKKLGLKFNSPKYNSVVELGENLIDDKFSFSIKAKCN